MKFPRIFTNFQKAREKLDADNKLKEEEIRSYSAIMVESNMQSNRDAKHLEEDFM
jgi:hypothetical protein